MTEETKNVVVVNGERVAPGKKVKLWEQTKKPMSRHQIREMIIAKRESKNEGSGSERG